MNTKELSKQSNEIDYQSLPLPEKANLQLDIIDESIRRKELTRLTEMEVVPFKNLNLPELEEDIINNVRLYKITEMVYQKGEAITDKFTTVFNTLQTYNASVFVILDSDGVKTNFYLGVRSNGDERSTVTLGDTLKNTLLGNFPGIKLQNKDRKQIAKLSTKINEQNNVASVSVVGNSKNNKSNEEQFVQGIEKLALSMQGRSYTGIIIAQNSTAQDIQIIRKNYQDLYTELSPLQKIQVTVSDSYSSSRAKSFTEMTGSQKASVIGSAMLGASGIVVGAVTGGLLNFSGSSNGLFSGSLIGGQIGQSLSGLVNHLKPQETISLSKNKSTLQTTENKSIIDLLGLLDEQIKRTNEFDSYGMWNVAGYFISDDMSAAEIAASNYRALMNGEKSGREVSAINSWRRELTNFGDLTKYISRFVHPQFVYGGNILTSATTAVSGKELGLHLGLPRMTVPGLPVIQHAEFGKEVNRYQLFDKEIKNSPKEKLTLGKVFDLGQITDKKVELNNDSLTMHTFITGSTGSGKSNTVYQIINELLQDQIPFLVIEPAKGEYKNVFGHLKGVNVFSTNPKIANLIKINPFKFSDSIHVLEHIDGLVEIFSVCWPMYDAMPAFFKDAILKSYESVGWDLGSSTFIGNEIEYPNFEILGQELEKLILNSAYSAEVKGNYLGALLTRVKSLTVGLNKFIFTNTQTPYEELFDQNCILDLSRVKSTETKALLMGLMVYLLNEHRLDQKVNSNTSLKHVTILEEAHNLLKNTRDTSESELMGKSVEMLTNTIAEIRTYGEGFIIVDQSPSAVDLSAIKNTNTKIVLRTPEENDRNAVGRSMGLTKDQVNEIAKIPSGVAVVYQNDWLNPVLTLVDKANISEKNFEYHPQQEIMPLRLAREIIIRAIMQPWLPGKVMNAEELNSAFESVEISQKNQRLLEKILVSYLENDGLLIWNQDSLSVLQQLLFDVLDVNASIIEKFAVNNAVEEFMVFIHNKTVSFTEDELNEICSILTWEDTYEY